VNVIADNKKLSALLEEVFKGTDFHYAIDGHKNVYIIKAREIQAELPDDFFDRGEPRRERPG